VAPRRTAPLSSFRTRSLAQLLPLARLPGRPAAPPQLDRLGATGSDRFAESIVEAEHANPFAALELDLSIPVGSMATATRIELRLKMDLPDDRQKKKALKALSAFSGIDSIAMERGAQRMTVIGCVDPVDVVCRLRKLRFAVHIVTIHTSEEKKEEMKPKPKPEPPKPCCPCPSEVPPVKFTLEFLNRITNNFSEERIIDRGRYGAIYKGVRDNGECVAVKKLNLKPGLEGEEFINEFNKLKRIQHRNITRLVGHCHHIEQVPVEHNGEYVSATVEERALCFEYLEGSLDKHLSNEPCGAPWYICYRIIRGICEGLDYLHKGLEHPIYHLDLKPTNIFLDRDMNPRIGGFGLSLFDSLETNNISEDMETRLLNIHQE